MSKSSSQFQAINLMSARLNWQGGAKQQDRMIKDKRWTFDRAVKYSYQAAEISKTESEDLTKAPALMNSNKNKPDYDEKILSVGFEYDYKPGDVFDWVNTGTRWLILLRELTELAYFRGEVRRCNYYIKWLDENQQEHKIYCAVRGPVETKINYLQKGGVSVDTPNHSLFIYMTKTEDTLKFFRRYSKFYLGNIDIGDKNTCWRVEATDTISMPGVLSINAVEYFANETEDTDEIAGGLIVQPVDPNEGKTELIQGETFIRPKMTYTYKYTGGESVGPWTVDSRAPIDYTIKGRTITLKWPLSYSGQFVIRFGDHAEKTIVVESLF